MQTLAKSLLLRKNAFLFRPTMHQIRHFGPKGKAGGGGAGGPPLAPYVPPVIQKTGFEVMIERGGRDQFIFGPPHGVEKLHNSHRNYIMPKIGQRMDMVAKKLREAYMREGVYPDVKIFFDAIRERQPEDSLQKLHGEGLVAAVISARDEFEDLDLVLPHRVPFTIWKTDHGMVRPFFIRHNDEEIMVTVKEIKRHQKTTQPVLVTFQRYIPGRPNLLTLPVLTVQEDKSLHFQAGAHFEQFIREAKVWCYNEYYPGVLEVDCEVISPQMSIKLGDLEKTLPHGMLLHKDHVRDRYKSIAKLSETNIYIQRKNQVFEQAELIRDEKKKIQNRLMNPEGAKKKRTTGMSVPKYIQASKYIMAEKKEAQKDLDVDVGKKKGRK